MYDIEKMQNETEKERSKRLQNMRQRRASETNESRASTLEKLRSYLQTAVANESEQDRLNSLAKKRSAAKELRHNSIQIGGEAIGVSVPVFEMNGVLGITVSVHEAMRETVSGPDVGAENDCVHEATGENVSVSAAVEATVPVTETGEESESVHEAEGVSKNEYLHEGGCQNVDNPLHELEFVQNEMHSFHLDQEYLEHRQCTMCKEAWPTRQNLASEVFICYRCKRDKKSPKKFSAENDMDPGTVPEQLRGLTQVEEMLISRVCPIMRAIENMGVRGGIKDMYLTYHKIFKVS